VSDEPSTTRPLWHEVLLVVAPVLVTEVMGALRDRWEHQREAESAARGLPAGRAEPSSGGT